MSESANIASFLPEMARQAPHERAIVCSLGSDCGRTTFGELDEQTNRLAHGLSEVGIDREMRVALMIPPGMNFFAMTFALFKLGAIPILIDPGMGIRGIGRCLADAEPAAFIGVPKAHLARIL